MKTAQMALVLFQGMTEKLQADLELLLGQSARLEQQIEDAHRALDEMGIPREDPEPPPVREFDRHLAAGDGGFDWSVLSTGQLTVAQRIRRATSAEELVQVVDRLGPIIEQMAEIERRRAPAAPERPDTQDTEQGEQPEEDS